MRNTNADYLEELSKSYAKGDFDFVIERAETIISAGSPSAQVLNILGLSQARKGNFKSAAKSFGAVLDVAPDFIDGHFNLALCQKSMGDLSAAVKCFHLATQSDPENPQPHLGLATTLFEMERYDEAVESFHTAIRCDPTTASAWSGLGRVLGKMGTVEPATTAFVRAIELAPTDASAYLELGMLLRKEGDWAQALRCQKRAAELSPHDASPFNALANTLRSQMRTTDAREAYKRALAIDPAHLDTLVNLASLCKETGHATDALANLRSALRHAPDDFGAKLLYYGCSMDLADWSVFDRSQSLSEESLADGVTPPPFPLLAVEDNPDRQLQRSRNWAKTKFRPSSKPPVRIGSQRPERLRIGYFSADIREHPVMQLVEGHLRQHDQSRFEVSVYSYGPPDNGTATARVAHYVEHFFDVRGQSDRSIVASTRKHELDVAIDLTGHTSHSRTGIFANRLAPVQVNYLGYPGSSGAPFMDYIVADPVVVPTSSFEHYSEKIIHLPYCYQANDNQKEIAETHTRRHDFGLPEDAFVYCCFNTTYKITPREFDIWMRCLDNIDDSVMWLISRHEAAEATLRKEAKNRGVDPTRLVFAKPLPNDEHLARHKHADLFLDTFIINAHTTASDALWAGVPLLSRMGQQFSARVAASLLTAIGLTELIVETDRAYEEMAIGLAQDPRALAELRTRLSNNRSTHPLFDTEAHCRALEVAYDRAYQRFTQGMDPDHFSV